MLRVLLILVVAIGSSFAQAEEECPRISLKQCCTAQWSINCVPKHCVGPVMKHCPHRKNLLFRRVVQTTAPALDVRRAPHPVIPNQPSPNCGTAESKYEPCTTRGAADRLFLACCQIYVPPECHSLCTYETDQTVTRGMLINMVEHKTCSLHNLSGILYCASQNRDNRKCCEDLELNASQLQVGSRCLRMCDPSGTAIEKIAAEDATCLFNWNVIMYCHHSGIREM